MAAGDLAHLQKRHIEDSLALQEYVQDGKTLLDVGSGGGFPGIPLAIRNPQLSVSLLERNSRKCSFLRHASMTLALSNVEVIEADVRELLATRKSFDLITSRAVAKPAQIWSWCRKLLAVNGRLLLQSSRPVEDQLPQGRACSYKSTGIGWVHVVEAVLT